MLLISFLFLYKVTTTITKTVRQLRRQKRDISNWKLWCLWQYCWCWWSAFVV